MMQLPAKMKGNNAMPAKLKGNDAIACKDERK
jgi:hypothetical protein